jgi:thiol-disulfide isomerase/thioredoxin
MKVKIQYLSILVCIFIAANAAWAVSVADKDYSQELKNLQLFVPEDAKMRAYLGIKETSGQIPLENIKADILIIEIFSMYCPHCQKHAPVANELYHAIESNKGLKDKIRMIGIGVGNSPYEVGIFQEKYSPPFPLFDDRNSAVVNAFGGILTPYYFGLKMNTESGFDVFYSKAGGYTDAEQFLDMIVKLSGTK